MKDGKTTLDSEDDAAIANMNEGWRMPTPAEIKELVEKCTWEWTTVNNVNGYKVTGKNGNSIFLPAAGVMFDKNSYYGGKYGYYLSNTLREGDEAYIKMYAQGFSFQLINIKQTIVLHVIMVYLLDQYINKSIYYDEEIYFISSFLNHSIIVFAQQQ